MSSTDSLRSLRSSSSCSTFSDATTLVDFPSASVETRSTHTDTFAPGADHNTLSTFGAASWANTEYKYSQSNQVLPVHLSHLSEIQAPSQLVQLVCRWFPKCAIAKKMSNAKKDGETIIEKVDAAAFEKREKKIQKILAREKVMAEEFSRLGW